MVFYDGTDYERKFIARQCMGNDEQSGMRAMLIKELNGQADEVVSVSCYKTSFFRGSPLKLLPVVHFYHPNLVGTHGIYVMFP